MTLITGTIESLFNESLFKTKKPVKIETPKINRRRPLEEFMILKDYSEKYPGMLAGYIRKSNVFDAYTSPTANCQLCSIAGFQNIFSYPNHIESILKECYQKTSKKLILVDIRDDYMSYFNEMIDKSFVVSKTPYTSTNGNHMVLILLNIQNLVEHFSHVDGD